jgi:murein DD-endopeptidase MepM/ murein hydrolase activator NlpD
LTRTHTRAGIAAAAIACSIAFGAPGAATSAAGTCDSGGGSAGGTGVTSSKCDSARYVNPFRHQRWYAGRIDMGVDYMPKRRYAVRAIGAAKVLGADSHSGWPGGHFIWYKLLHGDHKGDVVFVAETLKRLVPAGTRVGPGDRIAKALPGGTGIEMGWANKAGEPRAARCYSEGMKTHSGKEMARFLKELGADVVSKVKRAPDHPSGRRC